MSHTIRNLPVYQPSGTPAYGWVQFLNMVQPGDNVVINGDTYTFGVDFFGQSAPQALRSLVAAVLADQNDRNEVAAANTNFFRAYSALFEGNYAVLHCVVPGPQGNAFTLTTNAPTRIAISGAVFTGGASGSEVSSGSLTDASALSITTGGTSQTVFAANPNRRFMLIQNRSADPLYINFGAAATADAHSLMLAPLSGSVPGGSITFESSFIPTQSISIIGTTTGDAFFAKQG